jgi:hypothetical protein
MTAAASIEDAQQHKEIQKMDNVEVERWRKIRELNKEKKDWQEEEMNTRQAADKRAMDAWKEIEAQCKVDITKVPKKPQKLRRAATPDNLNSKIQYPNPNNAPQAMEEDQIDLEMGKPEDDSMEGLGCESSMEEDK